MKEKFEKIFLESRVFILTFLVITAIGITVSGIAYGQKFLMMLPLYGSLIIVILNSEALRIGALIGGINSILYAVVYYIYALYGQALSALLISFPFQIATFILWTKRRDGATTKFRSMSKKWKILGIIGLVVIYIPLLIMNINAGAALAPIDTAVSILGIVVTVLAMFAFVEYTYLSIIHSFLVLLLYVLMLGESPELTCYVVSTIYSITCIVRCALNVHKIYKKQQLENVADQKE